LTRSSFLQENPLRECGLRLIFLYNLMGTLKPYIGIKMGLHFNPLYSKHVVGSNSM